VPPPRSAGILLFRQNGDEAEVLLVHPGGPFWRNKDVGAWMIPKGVIEPGESAAEAAIREFEEELGSPLGAIPFPLCSIRQKAGKIVEVFAAEGDLDPASLRSQEFELEWPPRSGSLTSFPELDAAEWMALPEARARMLESQLPILEALEAKLRGERPPL
jgi:predicted NUDIX family NTP pyrophosphohydrolase